MGTVGFLAYVSQRCLSGLFGDFGWCIDISADDVSESWVLQPTRGTLGVN